MVAFECFAAERLRRDRAEVTRAWVERISGRLGTHPKHVLPTPELLDGVPDALLKAADFLEAGEDRRLTVQEVVTDRLRDVARLRRAQGYDVQEIVHEFDELAQVLDGAALNWLAEYPGTPDPAAVGRVFGRLNRAPLLMGEITVALYAEEDTEGRHAEGTRLRDFADTLMHQLKNPLGAAEGAALLLGDDEVAGESEERRRFAGIVERNLRRAREVIEDVRSLALAEMSQPVAERCVALNDALDAVLAEVRPLAEERMVRLEIRGQVPEVVVDASRAEVVLLNLVSNAVKYADGDKAGRWVAVEFEREPESGPWWVLVRDNGLGIPRELHDRVFERFFRAHPDAAEGTGLGLAIVQEALQQLGSRLEFESEAAVGSTFRFCLPVQEIRAAD